MAVALGWVWTSGSGRVISMGLDVFFQVLRALERLATELAPVRFERDMDSDVRGDVIALDHGDVAVGPTAGQVEVVGALATDVPFADVFLRKDRS